MSAIVARTLIALAVAVSGLFGLSTTTFEAASPHPVITDTIVRTGEGCWVEHAGDASMEMICGDYGDMPAGSVPTNEVGMYPQTTPYVAPDASPVLTNL